MSLISIADATEDVDSSIGLPYLDSRITARGDDEPAIGRPGYGIHPIGMTCIGEEMISGDSLPYLSGFIIAR